MKKINRMLWQRLLTSSLAFALSFCIFPAGKALADDVYVTKEGITAFENTTLTDIGATKQLRAKMSGSWVNEGVRGTEAFACNRYVYTSGDNSGAIRYEMQIVDGNDIKCVIIRLAKDGDNVKAAVIGTRNTAKSNGIGYAFASGDGDTLGGNQANSDNPATSATTDGYGLYDLRLADGMLPESISVNYHNGTALSAKSATAIGATGYEIPTFMWANTQGQNGTLSNVNQINSDGTITKVSGMSVKVEGSRGSYEESSFAATSDILHGYIDDNDNNKHPSIAITGVPYEYYRVLVYYSGDTKDRKFGRAKINGTEYTCSAGALAYGSSSWGGAIEAPATYTEGVNYLITPVLSGSTVTIEGERAGSEDNLCRAGMAAFTILKADAPTQYTYTATSGGTTAAIDFSGDGATSFWDTEPAAMSGARVNIVISGDTTINVNASKSISALAITGTGTLTLTGTGKLSVSSVTVESGVTLLKSSPVNLSAASDVSLSSGSTLDITGACTWSGAISGAGAVKVSADAVTFAAANTFTGGLTVASGGHAKATVATGFGPAESTNLVVQDGGAMDLGNTAAAGYSVTIAGTGINNSGALYSSTAVNNNAAQLRGITLSGNATIKTANNWGVIKSGWNAGTLNIGEYTLTKTGSANFWLCNTPISGTGKILVSEGNFTPIHTGSTFDGGTLQLESGTKLRMDTSDGGGAASIRIKTVTAEAWSAIDVKSGITLTVTDLTSNGTITDNGTIACTGTITGADESINIASGGTFTWQDNAWSSGDYFTGEGTLELKKDSSASGTSEIKANSSFSGIVKNTSNADAKSYVMGGDASTDDYAFTNEPELQTTVAFTLNGVYSKTPFAVRNFSGSGKVQCNYGANNTTRTLKTTQTKDTVFSGKFQYTTSGTRETALIVCGADDATEVHSLTLTGENETIGLLTAKDKGKVVLDSLACWGTTDNISSGTGKGILIADGGYLEVKNTSAVTPKLELQSGGTLVIATKMENDTTTAIPVATTSVTLPSDGYAVIDISAIPALADNAEQTIIACAAATADTDVSHLRVAGKNYTLKAVAGTGIVAVNDGGLIWSGGSWNKTTVDAMSRYAEATIVASAGANTVSLPGVVSFDKVTISAESASTVTITDNSATIKELVIGANVTLIANNNLEIDGATVSGSGKLEIPVKTEFEIENVTCAAEIECRGTLKTKGLTVLSSEENDFYHGSRFEIVNGSTSVDTYSRSYSGGFAGICTIDPCATGVVMRTDTLKRGSDLVRVNVYGVLSFGNKRWTVQSATRHQINLYPGSTIIGAGDSNGVLDFEQDESCLNVLNVDFSGQTVSSGSATIESPIKFRTSGNKTNVNVSDGMTLYLKGDSLSAGTMSVKTGTVVASALPSGKVSIDAGATFTLQDVAWTGSTADKITGEGTLNLYGKSGSISHTATASTFNGILRLTNTHSDASPPPYQSNLNPSGAATFDATVARPELVVDSDASHLGNAYYKGTSSVAGGKFFVRNVSGTGILSSEWTSSAECFYELETLQTKDTEFSGVFKSSRASSGFNRVMNVSVVGQNSTLHTLTLSGVSAGIDDQACALATLTAKDFGGVKFASAGAWRYGKVVVGSNGSLQSDSDSVVAQNLTLENGSYIFRGTQPVKVSTISDIDSEATIYVSVLPEWGTGACKILDGVWTTKPSASRFSLAPGSAVTADYEFVVADDGLYLAPASVRVYSGQEIASETFYGSAAAAIEAAAGQANTYAVIYHNATVTNNVYSVNVLKENGATFTLVALGGYEYTVAEAGAVSYSLQEVASTFTWANASLDLWNTAANWKVNGVVAGRAPNNGDAVVFPSAEMPDGGWQVSVATNNGGEKCLTIQADGNVTFVRGGSEWATVYVYGATIGGSGTVTLQKTGFRNSHGSDITVSCPVVSDSSGADGLFISGDAAHGFIFNSNIEAMTGQFKNETADVTYNGLVTIDENAELRGQGDVILNGTMTIASGGVAQVGIVGTKKWLKMRTGSPSITVNEGGKLSICSLNTDGQSPNATLTVNGGTIEAYDFENYSGAPALVSAGIATTIGNKGATFSVASDKTPTIASAITANGNITKTGAGTLTITGTITGSPTITVAEDAGAIIVPSGTAYTPGSMTKQDSTYTDGIKLVYGQPEVTISEPEVTYNVGYGSATITATVTADRTLDNTTSWSLVIDGYAGGPIAGTYSSDDGKVSFDVTGITPGSQYSYTISASGASAGSSGAQTSTAATVLGTWVNEVKDHIGSTGSWAPSSPSFGDNDYATLADTNVFTKAERGSGIVTLTNVVSFSEIGDSEIVIDSSAKAAIRVAWENDAHVYQLWTKIGEPATAQWVTVSGATPTDESLAQNSIVVFEFNTGTCTYRVKIGDSWLTYNESNTFAFANNGDTIGSVEYIGAGKFTSLTGVYATTNIIEAVAGTNIVVNSEYVSQYYSDKTVDEATATLSAGADKGSNGMNALDAYALGLAPDAAQPILAVSVNDDGKFVVTMTKADGSEITPPSNIELKPKLKVGTSPTSFNDSVEGNIINPGVQTDTVKYYKAEVEYLAK